jgi:signal transduction histidine kinase/CheY-like chemotaxis protein
MDEERSVIDVIGAAFLAMGADPSENIAKLTALCGTALRADAAAYYRVGGDSLFAVARWGLPDEFPTVASATLPWDPAWAGLGFAACAGRVVAADGRELGLIRALYRKERVADANDDAVLALVAGALAVEERRLGAEREKEKLSQALRQSMKMEAIGLLVGGISHDFNNSLTAICGNADLLRRRADLSPEAREETEEIAKAGQYASALTRQLLAFSRKQSVEPVVFDLNAVLSDLYKMLSRTVGERVRLELTPLPGVASVRADVSQIEQVVMNLAVNARDAMPEGGRLSIRVESVVVDPLVAPAELRGKSGRHIVLVVADSGTGIAPQVMERLFEPFFTTKDPGKGTGLGLATVHGIVLQNGGVVTVDSRPGCGAEFRVWLPAVEGHIAAPSRTTVPEEAPLAGMRVLFVEDEAPVRSLVGRVLRNAGVEIFEASCAEEALRLAAGSPAPDLLVTDIVMPGMSGYELARTLRVAAPDLPVVFISGYADEETLSSASSSPNSTVLMKPFTPSELVRRIRRTLADGDRPRL